MKKIFFIIGFFAFLTANLTAQNDAITRFFDKYMNDERFTVVYVSPKMFQLVSKVSTDDEDWEKTRKIVKGLKGLRVLVGEDMDGKKLYKEALTRVPIAEYDELITVRDKEENVRIWIRENSDNIIEELLLLVGSDDEFVLLSLFGVIDLDQIAELSESLDIDGAEHLNKIKQN